jgi:hypothetical protein
MLSFACTNTRNVDDFHFVLGWYLWLGGGVMVWVDAFLYEQLYLRTQVALMFWRFCLGVAIYTSIRSLGLMAGQFVFSDEI